MLKYVKITLLLGILNPFALCAQVEPDSSVYKKRSNFIKYGASGGYLTTMTILGQAWYKENLRSEFVFFNDNAQWKQIDKAGHFYSSFTLAQASAQALIWTGKDKHRSYLLGSTIAALAMLPIEIFDGFSANYGASWGDLVANATGSFLVYGQYRLWKEIRIKPKISFHTTQYAALRPNTLGSNLPEQILKDYNGHTLWLSVDVDKFVKFKGTPQWLNLAIGYGAEEMLYGRDLENISLAGLKPYRQYYLSVDLDFSYIHSDKTWVNALLFIVNTIHIPSPTLEFNQRKGVIFHPLYF